MTHRASPRCKMENLCVAAPRVSSKTGSTITEDVPADALSIARDTAEIRKGWATKYREAKEKAKKAQKK